MSSPGNTDILHVDDDPAFAELTAEMLERKDGRFSVTTAAAPSEGLDHLSTDEFDCIVSDYEMPGRDGIEFLQAVREDYPNLPFVLFTGKGSEEIASEAISAGVTDYLQKEPGTDQYTILANRIMNSIDRYDAEQKRRQWKQAIETANEGVAILSAEGEFRQMNETYAGCYDASPDALIGTNWRRWYPSEEVSRFEESILPALRREGTWEGESVGQRADGTEFDQDLSLSTLPDGGHVCVMEDITERKQRERELKRRQRETRRLRDLLQRALGVTDTYVWEWDLETDEVDRYPTVEPLFGMSTEELGDVDAFLDRIHPENREEIEQTMRASVESGEGYQLEFRVQTADGSWKWIRDRSDVITDERGEPVRAVGSITDISKAKLREQELQRQRRRFQLLFERLSQPTVEVEYEGEVPVVQQINPAFEEVFGFEAAEITGDSLDKYIVPETKADEASQINQRVKNGGKLESVEVTRRTADGNREFLLQNAVYDDGSGGFAIYTDITDRKQEQEQFHMFIKNSTDIISVLSEDGTYEYLSPSSRRILGYEPSELIGESAFKYVHPEDRQRVTEAFFNAVDNPGQTSELEYRFRHSNGSWLWIESRGTAQFDSVLDGFVVNSRDITERKRNEQALERQVERLDEFASVVSHDLRNPLNVAQGRLTLARENSDNEHLSTVARAHDRMEAIIEDVLSLAQAGEMIETTESVGLSTVANDSWRNLPTESATLVVNTNARIWADKGRLKQVFENLFRNALEHNGNGVTVTVGDLSTGFYIEDDGSGIPEDEQERVFQHGYSTAESGTGFGLSIVQDVITAHGWDIAVTSGQEDGTRIEITNVEKES